MFRVYWRTWYKAVCGGSQCVCDFGFEWHDAFCLGEELLLQMRLQLPRVALLSQLIALLGELVGKDGNALDQFARLFR